MSDEIEHDKPDAITALRAEVERLRAALRWIDGQRYTDRRTVTPDNAFEAFGEANRRMLSIMDRARAELGERQ